jgi:hypothetical protein
MFFLKKDLVPESRDFKNLCTGNTVPGKVCLQFWRKKNGMQKLIIQACAKFQVTIEKLPMIIVFEYSHSRTMNFQHRKKLYSNKLLQV